jgi:hypothetical protein
MKREMIPAGQWYLRRDTQELFQVIDGDDRSGAVRIQMFDGSLDELEQDIWLALSPEPVEPPEDWTGPLDNFQTDDFEEFEYEATAQSENYFRDEREPLESLLAEEGFGFEGEENGYDERQWAA